jgi:hypothetical protein
VVIISSGCPRFFQKDFAVEKLLLAIRTAFSFSRFEKA